MKNEVQMLNSNLAFYRLYSTVGISYMKNGCPYAEGRWGVLRLSLGVLPLANQSLLVRVQGGGQCSG